MNLTLKNSKNNSIEILILYRLLIKTSNKLTGNIGDVSTNADHLRLCDGKY
jgi:hypothetical protein